MENDSIELQYERNVSAVIWYNGNCSDNIKHLVRKAMNDMLVKTHSWEEDGNWALE